MRLPGGGWLAAPPPYEAIVNAGRPGIARAPWLPVLACRSEQVLCAAAGTAHTLPDYWDMELPDVDASSSAVTLEQLCAAGPLGEVVDEPTLLSLLFQPPLASSYGPTCEPQCVQTRQL